MEIASARPMENFSHTQVFDNSYHFGSGGTLLQFTTGTGADRPSCMFSFDKLNSVSIPATPAVLKSAKLLKENSISLGNLTCKRRLDFNHVTLSNRLDLQNENVNNNNNINSINNNNIINNNIDTNNVISDKLSHRQQSSLHQSHRQHRRNGQHQNQVKPLTTAVQRRNERERNRVKLINMTFATLREHLPNGTKGSRSKKMSKVETLKAAIEYIRYLQQLVDEHDAVSAVLDSNVLTSSTVLTSPSVLTSSTLSPSDSISSPNPSSCSDSSCEGISVDEDDLLDFSSWF